MRIAVALLCLAVSTPAVAEAIKLPSGQTVTLFERIESEMPGEETTWRYRFLAPQIARNGGTVDFEVASRDMQTLCDGFAVQDIASVGGAPDLIVIALMDRHIPFGQPMPEATQFIEAYRFDGGACTWEPF